MRPSGVIAAFAVACAGLAAVVACSSDDPATDAPDGALPDAPIDPRAEAGVDGGADGDADSLYKSGTRLKLAGTETAEGTFVFSGLFDSKLGAACSVSRATDGTRRCAPLPQAYVGSGGAQFSDDTCTVALATGPKAPCTAPKIAVRSIEGATPCDGTSESVQVGAEITLTKVFGKDGTGACVEGIVSTDQAYYPVTATIPAADLVALSEADAPITPALGIRVISGDDGSRYPIARFVDRARGGGKACDVTLAGDGKTRCTPRSGYATGASFSDGLCSARVGFAPRCLVPTEVFDDTTAATFDLGVCSLNTIRAFPLGAKRATKESFSKDADGGCSGPATSTTDVFDVGPEIAASTFPEIATGTAGGPRLTEQTYIAGGLVVSHRGLLRDTTLDAPCTFYNAADDKLRCLPRDVSASYFADAQCKVPLGTTTDTCSPTVKYILAEQKVGCASSFHVYLPGTRLDPKTTIAYLPINGTCTARPAGSSSALDYWTLGAEVPASTFAEGKAATR